MPDIVAFIKRKDFFIELAIFIIILLSPLIHGSITILPLSILETLCFLVFAVFVIILLQGKKISFLKIHFWPFLSFLVLAAIQLVNFPEGALQLISRSTMDLYRGFSSGTATGFSLSIYRETTIYQLLQLLSILAFFFVVLNFADDRKKIKRICFLIILAGFAYSVLGIIRKLATNDVVYSTFTNRNHFAAYVEMIIPLCIVYSLIEPSRTRRVMLLFAASVMALALFLSISRAGIISFSLSMLLLALLLRLKRRIRTGLILVIGPAILAGIFLSIIGFSAISYRLKTVLSPFQALSGRIEVLKDGPRIIADFPVFGTGLGTFSEIYQKYKTFAPEFTYKFAHNEPLQLMIETGILGFLLVIVYLVLYLKDIVACWFKRRHPFAVYLTLGFGIGIFAVGFHSFFDFVFHVPAINILFFTLLALARRSVYLKDQQELLPVPAHEFDNSLKVKVFLSVIIVFSMFFLTGSIWRRYQAEMIFEKSQKEEIAALTGTEAIIGYKKAVKEIDRAIGLSPLNSLYYDKKGQFLSELATRGDLKHELSLLDEFESGSGLLALARKNYISAINLNPTRADYHLRLGWLYSITGEDRLMREEFSKAELLDPGNKKIKTYIEQSYRIGS